MDTTPAPQPPVAAVPPQTPVTPPAPPAPPTPAKKPRSNLFLLIGFIIVVLLLGIGIGIFFPVSNIHLPNLSFLNPSPTSTPTPTPTPTPNPTADWKTYTNSSGQYSFKYPDQWNAATNSSRLSGALFGPSATSTSGLGGVEVNTSAQSVDIYVNNLVTEGVIGIVTQNPVTINRLEGIKIKYEGGGGPINGWSFYTKNGKSIYNIYINSWQDGDVLIFDQILSTFTFLDKTATPSVSPTASSASSSAH